MLAKTLPKSSLRFFGNYPFHYGESRRRVGWRAVLRPPPIWYNPHNLSGVKPNNMLILPAIPTWRTICLIVLLGATALTLAGFGGQPHDDAPASEPPIVGPVTNLTASAEGQGPGAVRLTWTESENAHIHFVLYLKSADATSGETGQAQVASFVGAQGTISGLEGGVSYNFIAVGVGWNPADFSPVRGEWSRWVSATPAAASPITDRNALIALYNATGGAYWYDNRNWLSDLPIGEWSGVTTDGDGRVIGINLPTKRHPLQVLVPDQLLSGAIPPELGSLTNLEELDLSENRLSGAIPPELGNLANLERLSLSGNRLSGAIPPELGSLANLEELYLDNNRLSGAIPPELGNLANLERLSLSGNRLSGAIPPELGNLANLERLSLSGNQLSGAIPPELGNLANLALLSLSSNQLSGAIPPELGNLANLELLNLRSNRLSGVIPPELGNLANLELLYLRSNRLSGVIPPELGNLANLELLYLYSNQLSGAIPPELGSLTNLERLSLSGNRLSGAIPPELGNLANLEWLFLSSNQLTGCIPQGLSDVPVNDFSELALPFCAP